jgi:hypothetical protein
MSFPLLLLENKKGEGEATYILVAANERNDCAVKSVKLITVGTPNRSRVKLIK